jgi:hypothetical protein
MRWIDTRGRLFGRVNLVDAAVALFVLALIPLGYAAYRIFRIPPPTIAGVTPGTIAIDAPQRLTLTGQHFRPYLIAYVSRTGEPFSLNPRVTPEVQQARFLIDTPTVVEIELPLVGPGTYDLHLFDEAQEVAFKQAAFTIVGPPPMTVEARVRFVVPPEAAPLVHAGDRDRWVQTTLTGAVPAGEAATISSVAMTKDPVVLRTPHSDGPGVALDATVRIPVTPRALGGWEYRTDWVRAGESLTFETERYRIHGVIQWTTDSARRSGQ